MISEDDITRIIQGITDAINAKRIILFGSCATQTMTSDSDIDLLVIVDDSVSELRQIVQLLHQEIYALIGMPCDILVEHERTFRDRSALPTIERAIAREGRVLYAA